MKYFSLKYINYLWHRYITRQIVPVHKLKLVCHVCGGEFSFIDGEIYSGTENSVCVSCWDGDEPRLGVGK